MDNKGLKSERENFTVEVKYSDEAIAKKLIKFTVTKGNEVVVSADDLMSILVNQVNAETLSAAFVETNKINVVQVQRQLKCRVDRDLKKGDVVNINYIHPYPVEYALIEEAFKIAQISKDVKVTELTAEYLESVRKRITPKMVDFTKKFYSSFNSINIKNKKMSEEYTGELAKFKVIGEIVPVNHETGEPEAALEIGSVHEVPVALGNDWVTNGLAEKVEEVAPVIPTDDSAPLEQAPAVDAEAAPVEVEGVDQSEKDRINAEAIAKANSNHSDTPPYTGPTNF